MVEIPGGVLRRWSDGWSDDKARVAELEAAMRAHRQAVGQAYGIGSFKAQAAANRALWALVTDDALWPDGDGDADDGADGGLVRPAMMEDTE